MDERKKSDGSAWYEAHSLLDLARRNQRRDLVVVVRNGGSIVAMKWYLMLLLLLIQKLQQHAYWVRAHYVTHLELPVRRGRWEER